MPPPVFSGIFPIEREEIPTCVYSVSFLSSGRRKEEGQGRRKGGRRKFPGVKRAERKILYTRICGGVRQTLVYSSLLMRRLMYYMVHSFSVAQTRHGWKRGHERRRTARKEGKEHGSREEENWRSILCMWSQSSLSSWGLWKGRKEADSNRLPSQVMDFVLPCPYYGKRKTCTGEDIFVQRQEKHWKEKEEKKENMVPCHEKQKGKLYVCLWSSPIALKNYVFCGQP